MTIFVTGASGYIGRHVTDVLLKDGLEVIGLARSDDALNKIESLGAKAFRGDLNRPEEWVPQAAQAAAVVHIALAGADADRKLVPMLIDALAGTDKPFIYTSGVWVMGSTGDRLAGESWSLKPPPIAAWRQEIERTVLDSRERKVCGVVLRPATVYGGTGEMAGGVVQRMLDAARRDGVIRVPGDGTNRKSYVHAEDLADLYLAVLNHAAAGELFVAADGPALPMSQVAAAVSRAAGNLPIEYVPAERARAEMGPIAEAHLLDQRIGSTKAGRQLGWKPSRAGVLQFLASISEQ